MLRYICSAARKAPTGEERGGAYCRHAHSLFLSRLYSILYGVIRKNDFDQLTSSGLDLWSRSLKFRLLVSIMSNHCAQFHKGKTSSFCNPVNTQTDRQTDRHG